MDEKRPAGQPPVTAERPVVAQYDPAEQASHPLDPVELSNVPVAHDEQELAPAFEYLPDVQDPVTAERPVVAQ